MWLFDYIWKIKFNLIIKFISFSTLKLLFKL